MATVKAIKSVVVRAAAKITTNGNVFERCLAVANTSDGFPSLIDWCT